jgi:hypothetical protein
MHLIKEQTAANRNPEYVCNQLAAAHLGGAEDVEEGALIEHAAPRALDLIEDVVWLQDSGTYRRHRRRSGT